ncbi:MAG TPA: glycosyltransferase family 9 protein [Cyclobacteriaceae bacterium]|jgi:heptosyltransferase-2|nr:glycosyltransferase family 9 protein [Cyclobacteriaceae bacterium]
MVHHFRSFLIIQTAFIGDVILATALIEKLRQHYPEASIDFLVRKGNEGLLTGHPSLRNVLVWNKKESKLSNLVKISKQIRSHRYDCLVNVHRFASSGFITAFSKAGLTIGFDKNPLSFLFDKRIKHEIGVLHEVERNQKLIEAITDQKAAKPRLFPSPTDFEKVKAMKTGGYLCIAPTSVWFTKQLPAEKWIEFLNAIGGRYAHIYLLGAPSDHHVCESIRLAEADDTVKNLAGKLTFLESAALMKDAVMNFVNDSAPMHIASAMNAPVTAVYCSTVPSFGFGPLSDRSFVVETQEKLSCRPCGLHGYKDCPQGHFKCAYEISIEKLVGVLK